MKLDLWVRLNITMADDNKVSGWTQIYGKHELATYKKPFKSLKPIVNDHIEKMNWLTICNRWGETNKVIEVNTSKIKKYAVIGNVKKNKDLNFEEQTVGKENKNEDTKHWVWG